MMEHGNTLARTSLSKELKLRGKTINLAPKDFFVFVLKKKERERR